MNANEHKADKKTSSLNPVVSILSFSCLKEQMSGEEDEDEYTDSLSASSHTNHGRFITLVFFLLLLLFMTFMVGPFELPLSL